MAAKNAKAKAPAKKNSSPRKRGGAGRGDPVSGRKEAMAIGLSESRKKGAKLPQENTAHR